ncbi:competence protein ComEC [Pseudodesulfovibrio senegalensis]|uniref:Competence protein ComEC n=1 Tax=Pseudodesulfovibrio senegalensis TaxID=1721087 RepID=A0A6N6N1Y3_9BACT|nr:competence protein ComEC [Pseudodesulfovibrio senegalensis]KAB1440870.1 competence protein ComEC [Pseudodesulfovibrio senegalensis]
MSWLSNPLVWVFLLPALAASGLVFQMTTALFSCCATFRLRGRSVLLRWWMIPAGLLVSAVLWACVFFTAFAVSGL